MTDFEVPCLRFCFQGSAYWRYSDTTTKKLDTGYPNSIANGFHGVPSNLDAAFVWSGNGMTYFIKGIDLKIYLSK